MAIPRYALTTSEAVWRAKIRSSLETNEPRGSANTPTGRLFSCSECGCKYIIVLMGRRHVLRVARV